MTEDSEQDYDLNGSEPLKHYVTGCLNNYFQALNGHQPNDLYRLVINQVEAPLLEAVMQFSEGNQSRAAAILGINRGTLRKKLRFYQITVNGNE